MVSAKPVENRPLGTHQAITSSVLLQPAMLQPWRTTNSQHVTVQSDFFPFLHQLALVYTLTRVENLKHKTEASRRYWVY